MPVNERIFDLSNDDLSNEGTNNGSIKILMLEDDVEFADLLRAFFESHSFQVTCVTNGVAGLRQTMATDFDVILCDMVMPNLPGDMFYLAVQRTRPHLSRRFIFMTGYKAVSKVDEFIRRVQGLVLWKPFQMQELLDAIQTILHQNRERVAKAKSTPAANRLA